LIPILVKVIVEEDQDVDVGASTKGDISVTDPSNNYYLTCTFRNVLLNLYI